MKIRIHPILLPVFFFLMIVGGVSLYAMILCSLLVHEFGHLAAAKRAGMKVRSCTILPYGGELQIVNRHVASKRQRLSVALGGPLATAVLLVIALAVTFPGSDQLVHIQLVLLGVNCLPILPLDGGQAVSVLFEREETKYAFRSSFMLFSIIAFLLIIVMLSSYLPESLPYMLLALFLAMQNIHSYRFRKYEQVFEQLSRKRLT